MRPVVLTLLAGCAGAAIWMTLLYGVRRLVRNAGVVDVGWAFGVGGLALALAVADRQLAQWRSDPANWGQTCRRGLWRYSRHPNYFFEWLHWWTYVLLGVGAPWGWMTLFGPAVMLLFLFRFTGIPYTEAQALKSRGEDYARYQQTTSAFFPWFPRRSE